MEDKNNRVKVVGYAQRVFYDNGIEYRNFSDDLVGNQTTEGEDGASSVFTFGNFVTRINNLKAIISRTTNYLVCFLKFIH